MTITELLISFLPLLVAIAGAILILRKSGAFEQREHRQRVEQLLERITMTPNLSFQTSVKKQRFLPSDEFAR